MANSRRRLIGRVVSDKMDKTVVVSIERRKMHRVYKKVVRTTKKVMAHDETNAVEVGSVVQVVESKPISKSKRWVVERVLEGPGGRVLEPIAGEIEETSDDEPAEEVVDAAADEPADEPADEATDDAADTEESAS